MEKVEKVMLFRVTLAVAAEQLPQVHSAVAGLAHVADIQHWYDEPQTTTEVEHVEEVAPSEPSGVSTRVPGGTTLVQFILTRAIRSGGVSRAHIKTWAQENDFNVGSVSPTLVKLVAQKRIKRIGPGLYGPGPKK
jgi:hypothetical protein